MSLLVIAACSGTGKSTLAQRLLSAAPRLRLSVSATTRSPRPGETAGVHYHFVQRARFEAMIAEDALAEWAQYAGQLYGTPRSEIERAAREGYDLLLDVEVVGAAAIKAAYPEASTVFVVPPSWAALEARLRGRGTETEASIERRMRTARREVQVAHRFDYLVLNDDLDAAATELRHVYQAAACTMAARRDLLDRLIS